MLTPEISLAITGLILTMFTWGVDKIGILEKYRIGKKIIGVAYILFSLILTYFLYTL